MWLRAIDAICISVLGFQGVSNCKSACGLELSQACLEQQVEPLQEKQIRPLCSCIWDVAVRGLLVTPVTWYSIWTNQSHWRIASTNRSISRVILHNRSPILLSSVSSYNGDDRFPLIDTSSKDIISKNLFRQARILQSPQCQGPQRHHWFAGMAASRPSRSTENPGVLRFVTLRDVAYFTEYIPKNLSANSRSPLLRQHMDIFKGPKPQSTSAGG